MRVLRLAGVAVVIAGCGGSGGGNGGPGPDEPVASVGITPGGAQSTALCGNIEFTATPRSASGSALTRNVSWAANPPTFVSLSSTSGGTITVTGVGAGTSTITATSSGIQSTGVAVNVGAAASPPATAAVSATSASAFSPTCVVIAAGGTVTWTFGATEHNVNFDNTTPPGGDIGNTANTTAQRTFPAAGHYPYQCTLHAGMRGRVIVQ